MKYVKCVATWRKVKTLWINCVILWEKDRKNNWMYIEFVENTQNENWNLIASSVSIYLYNYRKRRRTDMEGVRTSRLFFSMLVLRFTNEHMSIVRTRIAIFRSFAFFLYEIHYCYVLESKFITLGEDKSFFRNILGVLPSQMNYSIDWQRIVKKVFLESLSRDLEWRHRGQ